MVPVQNHSHTKQQGLLYNDWFMKVILCSPFAKLFAVLFYCLVPYFYRCAFLKVFYLQVISLGPIWLPRQFWEGKMKISSCLKVLDCSESLKMHQLHWIYCYCLKNKCKHYLFIFSSSTIHSKPSETKVLLAQHLPALPPITRWLYDLRGAMSTGWLPTHPSNKSIHLFYYLSVYPFDDLLCPYPYIPPFCLSIHPSTLPW